MVKTLEIDMRSVISEFKSKTVDMALCGRLSAICLRVNELPRSNRSAVKRHFLISINLIKDSIEEFSEMTAEPLALGEAVIEDVDDDFGGLDLALDENEIIRTNKCVRLMKAIAASLKATLSTDLEKNSHVGALDSFANSCSEASRRADDLGVTLYPPQDPEDVSKAALELLGVLSPSAPLYDEAEQLVAALKEK